MTVDKVVLTEHELEGFNFNDPQTLELIELARQCDVADKKLTIKEALIKYRKAVFWAMCLSISLVMEGYDLVIITSFYGQTQFQQRFGTYDEALGKKIITAPWMSGLSNSSQVGQIFGLIINAFCQDRYGSRYTYMFFMVWMAAFISIPVFATSLDMLAAGEALCGISWGIFQTLSTSYACEVVPTILRPIVTAWVCMCWGLGILISSAVVRAVAGVEGDLGWRLPFLLQWVWPLPLFILAYFTPESPWNAVRRNKLDLARESLVRLCSDSDDKDKLVEAQLAYIRHTTAVEKAETHNASFLECFKGINLRRTEINVVVWAAQILSGNALLGQVIIFLQAAGWSELQSFNLNISLSACYLVGGAICWFLFPHFGRSTLYMAGLALMWVCLVVIGGLGCAEQNSTISLAIGIVFVVTTLINMITTGPVCYPIVSETPSGRLRYKTITIGRAIYNVTTIFANSLTPRMVNQAAWNWGAKTAFFYAGTNLLCLIWCWFRLPETKDRTFGEIDILFDNKIPARKFKYTQVDQFTAPTDHALAEKEAGVSHHEG